jgi:hypothetical protein
MCPTLRHSPSTTCAQGVCPTPRQEPKYHMSPRGFSSIIIVVTQFLTHLFDKIFKKSKNNEKQQNPKTTFFNIFASFLAFSASSQKNLNF